MRMLESTACLCRVLYILIGALFVIFQPSVFAEDRVAVPILPPQYQQTVTPQSGPLSQSAPGVLAGSQWRIELTPTGKRRRDSRQLGDTLTFSENLGTSSRLASEGYSRARFDAVADDQGAVQWEMLQSKQDQGAALWKGSVKRGRIEGTLSVYDLGGTHEAAREFTFKGELLGGAEVQVSAGEPSVVPPVRRQVATETQSRAPKSKDWNKTLNHLQERIENVKSAEVKVKRAEDTAQSLQYENKGLKEALDIKTQEISYLQEQLDSARKELEEKESKQARSRSEKNTVEEKLSFVESEVSQLKKANFELEHELKSTQELNAVLQGKLRNMDRMERKLRDAEDQLAAADSRHSAKRVARLQDEIEGFRNTNADLQLKIKQLEDSKKPYEKELKDLKKQISRLEQENTQLTQDKLALSDIKHPNEAELLRLRAQVEKLSKSQEDLLLNRASLMTAQEELKQARTESKDLKLTNASLLREMEKLYTEIDEKQGSVAEKSEAYASLQEQWDNLQEAHSDLQDRFVAQIEEIEKLKVASEQDIMTSRLRAAASERTAQELETGVDKLRSRLEEKNAEIELLNKQLLSQDKSEDESKQAIADLRDELKAVRLGHADAVKKLNQLRNEHKEVSEKYTVLQQQRPISLEEYQELQLSYEVAIADIQKYQEQESAQRELVQRLAAKEQELVELKDSTAASRIKALHAEVEHFRMTNLKLNEELAELRLAINEKEESFNNADETNARLRAEVKHYQQQLFEKGTAEGQELRLLKEELRAVKIARDEAVYASESKGQELANNVKETEDLHAQLYELEKRLSDAYQQQEQYKQQIHEVKLGSESTSQRVKELQQTLRERDEKVKHLSTQLVEVEGKLTSAYREHEAFQDEFFERRIQQTQMERQTELAQDKLRDKDAEIARLRAEIETLQPQVDESHRGYVLMERQSAELRAERNKLSNEVKALNAKLAHRDDALAELTKKNADIQRKLQALRLTEMRQHLHWAEQETESAPGAKPGSTP